MKIPLTFLGSIFLRRNCIPDVHNPSPPPLGKGRRNN